MSKETVPKLPTDLIDAAFDSETDHCPQMQYLRRLLEAANDSSQSCPYNSLHDKHLKAYFKRTNVKEFLHKVGLVDADGAALQTKEEDSLAAKARHLLAERESILRKLEQKERERLERVRKLVAKTDSSSVESLQLEKQSRSIQETQRKLMLLRAQEGPLMQENAANECSADEVDIECLEEDSSSKVMLIVCANVELLGKYIALSITVTVLHNVHSW